MQGQPEETAPVDRDPGEAAPPRVGGPARPGTLLELAREILGLIAAIGSLSLVMRALIVAHFDLTVTGALTANASTTTFVASTLVQVGPLALYAVAAVAAYHAGLDAQAGRRARPYLLVLAGALALPLLGTSEIVIGLLLLAGVPASFLVGRTQDRRGLVVRVAAWLGAAVLVVNFLPVRMWLPPERAVISGVTETVYVLRESGEDLVIFDPRSVSVLRVPLRQVTDRQFCQAGDRRTVGELLLGRAERRVPPCP